MKQKQHAYILMPQSSIKGGRMMALVCVSHGLTLSEIIYNTWKVYGINHVCDTCCCLPIPPCPTLNAHKSIKEDLYRPKLRSIFLSAKTSLPAIDTGWIVCSTRRFSVSRVPWSSIYMLVWARCLKGPEPGYKCRRRYLIVVNFQCRRVPWRFVAMQFNTSA